MPARRTVALLAAAVLAVGTLTACSAPTSASGSVSVVASTDVYGNIAEQIIGHVQSVHVTSVITSPSQDPHTFEPGARTELALAKAQIVIENGGGYDDFMNRMLDAAHNAKAVVLNAVTISGIKTPADGDLNEHVWYDFPTVERLTVQLVAALAKADPSARSAFTANGRAFMAKLRGLTASEVAIKAQHHGAPVAITEPVPLYLLQACGLVNRTPHAFSEAVENGTDVSPRVLEQMLTLFSDRSVRLLAYNEQAVGPQTQAVLTAAKAHQVPVVPVTETLPSGDTFISWMKGNLAAVAKALAPA
jgi:zinc/manganese transport system substrate-binding protein